MIRSSSSLARDLDPAAHRVVPAGDAGVGHADADRALVLVGLALREQAARLGLAALHPIELEGDLPVPVEPEPGERLLDLLGRLGDLAPGVGVLDAQVELAALVPGEEPVEERGANAADVEEAGRATERSGLSRSWRYRSSRAFLRPRFGLRRYQLLIRAYEPERF